MTSILSTLTNTVKDTLIVILLDRSGSMGSIAGATIKGYNDFLKDQKAIKGKADLKFIQFDDGYDIIHDFKDIQDVEELTDQTFRPRGTTALYDAIARTIIDLEKYLKAKTNKPQLLFVIITDGLENASEKYSQKDVFKMISKNKKKNWEFAFLGANQDSFATGGAIGIGQHSILNYQATTGGVQTMSSQLSDATRLYRLTGQYKYADPDDLKDDDDTKDNK